MDIEMSVSLWFICDSKYIVSLEIFAALLAYMPDSFFKNFLYHET